MNIVDIWIGFRQGFLVVYQIAFTGVAAIVGVYAGWYLLVTIGRYFCLCVPHEETVHLTFEIVKTHSVLCPDRWKLDTTEITYDEQEVTLSVIDAWRYLRWLRKREHSIKSKEQLSTQAALLIKLQEDISSYKVQIATEIEGQRSETTRLVEQIKKGGDTA